MAYSNKYLFSYKLFFRLNKYRSRKCISNYAVDPTTGMSTEPLKFPNLVTGFQRNPVHASQSALHTRYTPNEWFQKQIKFYNEADAHTFYSERMRNDAVKIMR